MSATTTTESHPSLSLGIKPSTYRVTKAGRIGNPKGYGAVPVVVVAWENIGYPQTCVKHLSNVD